MSWSPHVYKLERGEMRVEYEEWDFTSLFSTALEELNG
jgi:hypothetical protein